MPLSTLVAIVLRLYAIHWIVGRLGSFLQTFIDRGDGRTPVAFYFLAPAVLILLAVLVFVLAGWFARKVTRGLEVEVGLGGLSAYDLYCFAFTGLGLYFALTSAGSVLQWVYQTYEATRATPLSDPFQRTWYFVPSLVTFVAGFLSLFFATQMARAVHRVQRRGQTE